MNQEKYTQMVNEFINTKCEGYDMSFVIKDISYYYYHQHTEQGYGSPQEESYKRWLNEGGVVDLSVITEEVVTRYLEWCANIAGVPDFLGDSVQLVEVSGFNDDSNIVISL